MELFAWKCNLVKVLEALIVGVLVLATRLDAFVYTTSEVSRGATTRELVSAVVDCASSREEGADVNSIDYAFKPNGRELTLMTWQEAESYVRERQEASTPVPVIIPIGATEQHGPIGLIGTDTITAEAVSHALSDATGYVIAPAISVGMSLHHTRFPGSLSLTPSTLIAVLKDYIRSLSNSGFTHILFVNGHGGNVGPILKSFADYYSPAGNATDAWSELIVSASTASAASVGVSDSSPQAAAQVEMLSKVPVKLKLVNWYMGKEVSALTKELYREEQGQHATPDEVAMTQFLLPEHVKQAVLGPLQRMEGRVARRLETASGLSYMDPADFRERFFDGRMWSNSGLANPEDGRKIYNAAVRDVLKTLQSFLSDDYQ